MGGSSSSFSAAQFENNGFTRNPRRLQNYKVFGLFWVLVFLFIYFVYSINNLGVILDDQEADRYVTFTFWRLAASGLDIFAFFFFVVLLVFPTELFQNVSCLFQFVGLVFDLVLLGWLGFDATDCANVPHCDGDGMGPLLDLDIAFIALVGTLIFRAIWFLGSLAFCLKLRTFYLDVRNCCAPMSSGGASINIRPAQCFPQQFQLQPALMDFRSRPGCNNGSC